jgi:hypothetical protein
MPKKKLTKAQVRKKTWTAYNALYDMFLDKFGHANSDVSMSKNKLVEMLEYIQQAQKRMK